MYSKEKWIGSYKVLVNCKGKTGRFRVIAMDESYNEKNFDKSISIQLLKITKKLNGWQPKVINGTKF